MLPLPQDPSRPEMLESRELNRPEIKYKTRIVDETRYESARWWRNLNRVMSVVGLLIIGAVVALVVVGFQQGWVVR